MAEQNMKSAAETTETSIIYSKSDSNIDHS